MSFSETDLRNAAAAIDLRPDQVSGLLAVLKTRQPVERVRFDLVHLLWYAGALIVMGAMGLFSTLAFEQMGGAALTITAILYAAMFAAAGHYLWHRRHLRTPGGLLIAVAVGMIPLAVYGIQDSLGWWGPDGNPGRYGGFYIWVKSSWLPMEIATVIASLVALRFYPFAFITAVMALALWFMSMDLTPWLLRLRDDSGLSEAWQARRVVSMIFGLSVMILAWLIDLKRHMRQDFAFWLHLCGLLAFWGGLTFAGSSNEFTKAMYCLVNVALVFLSVFLMRRFYSVFGAIGIAVYLGHLANRVFENSLLFPFALSLIGVGIIGAGLFLHRHRASLSAWMSDRLPPFLKKLRPPLARDATRMEHS